jgi:Flp pilus assembly protein TadG
VHRSHRRRAGSIVPLLAVSIVALLGFVALAIDIGLMAMARTQCQNAADCAALTGARTLSGDPTTNNNFAACEPAARTAASANKVLGTAVNGASAAVMTVSIGAYAYDPVAGQFSIKLPKGAADPYCLVRVNMAVNNNATYFARVFNVNSFNTAAMATAAHRPRDVSLVMDFSGSMRFGSLIGVPYNGTRDNGLGNASGSNNPEAVYPKFGHYSSSTAGLQSTTDLTIGSQSYVAANVTEADAANDTRPAVVGDFYQHPPYTDPDIPAFNNTVNGTGPNIPADSSLDADKWVNDGTGGDRWLRIGNSSSTSVGYAKTVADITGGTTAVANFDGASGTGYDYYYNMLSSGLTFKGFTRGPRYWGKTFFIWPPDPRTSFDWRKKFFTATSGSMDNTKLWDSSGNWQSPDDVGYTINYTAILSWIKNTGTNPFPPRLHAGHVTYYTSIPDSIDTSSFPPTDLNQRFWKEYIDHCLGVQQTGSSSWSVITPKTGYGDDYTWGTIQIGIKPSGKYMNYQDNPERPRTHFWFGPMSMVDFIGNYNANRMWWPGTCHEAPLYACKLGVRAALTDCENNHPNDFMSLILFSSPRNSSSDTTSRFNTVRVPLGKNYPLMQNALWYPLSTLNADGTDIGTDITPYDTTALDTPRAYGGTCYSMALMLAYNQFQYTTTSDTVLRKWIAPSTTVAEGMVGGEGRKGSQKMVIFMTDGAPNVRAAATKTNSGTVKYYPIRYNAANPSTSEYPTTTTVPDNDSTVRTEIYGIIDQMVTDYTAPRKPFRLHTLAFGPVFDSSNGDSGPALTTLQGMQFHGGTQTNASTALDSFKILTGNDATVITNLQTAIKTIMQGSIQIVLLE